jgi:cell division protein FtsQ
MSDFGSNKFGLPNAVNGRVDQLSLSERCWSRLKRFGVRFFNVVKPLPQGVGSLLALSLLGSTVVYAAVVGGQSKVWVSELGSNVGLSVDRIKIDGLVETSKELVVHAIQAAGYDNSLLGLDLAQAQKNVVDLPWVEGAELRKVYPGFIQVSIQEKQPFALWQRHGEVVVIERDGSVIDKYQGSFVTGLPFVVGEDASERAYEFVQRIKKHKEVYNKAASFIRVSKRRWDVRLKNGMLIQLPEGDFETVLAEIALLDHRSSLLSRDVLIVDCRVRDRIALRLPADLAEKRREVLKKRVEEYKKSGRQA